MQWGRTTAEVGLLSFGCFPVAMGVAPVSPHRKINPMVTRNFSPPKKKMAGDYLKQSEERGDLFYVVPAGMEPPAVVPKASANTAMSDADARLAAQARFGVVFFWGGGCGVGLSIQRFKFTNRELPGSISRSLDPYLRPL